MTSTLINAEMMNNTVNLLHISNKYCRVVVAPDIGGRIVNIQLISTGDELLWHNPAAALQPYPPDSPYDPYFYGGIDELLPCDVPEIINGINCPDHGELWTTSLKYELTDNVISMHGILPRFGLRYEKKIQLSNDSPELICNYRISNPTDTPRHFLWKLHAALAISPGDTVDCPAVLAQPVDPDYTTCPDMSPFMWPMSGEDDKSIIPSANGQCEFLYLYDLTEGRMGVRSKSRNLYFTYYFDTAVFPYAWLFQSFGGFDGHYTTVLEPCTSMPIMVNDAAALGQCTILQPGEELTTTVRIAVGNINTEGI
jgi:galactose mutarotase-like enzyme